jgi:TRAP-type C4-dicarboxylate transport system substrate-binding protein
MDAHRIALTLGAAGLAALAAADAGAKTLRFSEFGPNRGTRAAALDWLAAEIEKRSGGALKLDIHWGGALLSAQGTLKGIGDGVADMGSITGFFDPKALSLYNLGDLPVDNADEWIGMRAFYDLVTGNAAFDKQFAQNNIVYVTNYTTGPVQLVCTKPVKSLENLRALKVRGSGPYARAFSDLGAVVQSIPQPKVYQALDSGLITCNQNYWYAIKAYKQYEVAPYATELNWGQNMSFGVVMNRRSWDALDAKEKDALRATGDAFIDKLAHMMIDGGAKDRAAMVAGIDGKTLTIAAMPPEDRAKLTAAGKKYIDAWVSAVTAEGFDGKRILASYEQLIARYAGELKAKGYPWRR